MTNNVHPMIAAALAQVAPRVCAHPAARLVPMIDDRERYLRVVKWADRRYRHGGLLTLSVGGQPAPYKRIETAAARRYLGIGTNGNAA
jgi:hypothetical protein